MLLPVVQICTVHAAIHCQDSDAAGKQLLTLPRLRDYLKGQGGLKLEGGQLEHCIIAKLICLHCKV